MTKHYATATIQ